MVSGPVEPPLQFQHSVGHRPIENLNGSARWTCRNVKRWKGGTMILRWCCAAMNEAQSRFRRIKAATSGMPVLLTALRENDRVLDGAVGGAIETG
jgi:hypothetical protein